MSRHSLPRRRTVIAGVLAILASLLGGCAYTAPYRPTTLATNGGLHPQHPAIVVLTAVEHRPGRRGDFFKDTRRVLADLPPQDGLLGYSFRFELWGKEAWTVSAWRDEASLDAFVRSPAHLAAMRRSSETAQNLRFITVRRPLSSLPPRWDEVVALLKTAPPRSPPARPPVSPSAR